MASGLTFAFPRIAVYTESPFKQSAALKDSFADIGDFPRTKSYTDCMITLIDRVEAMVKWVILMVSRTTTTTPSNDYSFNSTTQLQARVQGHAQWIQQFLDAGWDGYLFTVMFNNLPGKRDTKIIQMHQEATTLYGRLARAMVRKRQSPKWAGYFPIAIFSPDLPVPKSINGQKSTVADVSINDGLHSHGIVLANRWGRVQVPLDEYFEENGREYLTGKIRNIVSELDPLIVCLEAMVKWVIWMVSRTTTTTLQMTTASTAQPNCKLAFRVMRNGSNNSSMLVGMDISLL